MDKRVVKHNPAFLTKDQLVQSFVVRLPELETILTCIRENTAAVNQHMLVVAPRGMGKTMLVRRIAYELQNDSNLSASWLPVVIPEESYNVATEGELWLRALEYAARELSADRWEPIVAALSAERDEQRLRDGAVARLNEMADETGRRLLVVVENLNMLLGEQGDDDMAWRLRKTLLNERRLMLLSTATVGFSLFDGTTNYAKALFEVFREIDLPPLTTEECATLWNHLTGQDLDAKRLRPLEILTGGSPRLLAVLASVAVGSSFAQLMTDLTVLVDDHTTYFKANVESLPPVERRVYVTLAEIWQPALAKEVAERARMPVSKTSALLKRLKTRGAVTEVDREKGKIKYQVSERLFNIYHLMRQSSDEADRARVVVGFMVGFYERKQVAALIAADAIEPNSPKTQMCRAAYHHLLAQCCDEAEREEILAATTPSFVELIGPFAGRESARLRQTQGPHTEAENKALELLFQCLEHYENGEFAEVIAVADEIVETWNESEEPRIVEIVGMALADKSLALVDLNRAEEAINIADKIVARRSGNEKPDQLYLVAIALNNKGNVLGSLGRADEAIATYDQVVAKFAQREEPALLEQVAWALVNKGHALQSLGRADEAIATYDQVVAKFAQREEPALLEQVAWALVNKGYALGSLGRADEAIATYDQVVAKFAQREEPALLEPVARALVNKGYVLRSLGRADEAVATYDQVAAKFAEREEPALLEPVARALVNKGYALGSLGRADEAIATYDQVVAKFAEREEPGLLEQVARALVNKGNALRSLSRADEAIATYDQVVAKFAEREEPGLLEQVARALVNKGYALGSLSRADEEIATYDQVVAKFAEREEPELLEKVAMALVNKGYALGSLRRADEEIATYDQVVAKFAQREEPGLLEQVARARNGAAWTVYDSDMFARLPEAVDWAREACAQTDNDILCVHTLACLLGLTGQWNEAFDLCRRFLPDETCVEQYSADVIRFFIDAAAAGQTVTALKTLRESPAAPKFEPLVVALQMLGGEKFRAPQEVVAVANDVVDRIEERRQQLTQAGLIPAATKKKTKKK